MSDWLVQAGSEWLRVARFGLIDRTRFAVCAVIPLADDLIDYLIERSPKFRAD